MTTSTNNIKQKPMNTITTIDKWFIMIEMTPMDTKNQTETSTMMRDQQWDPITYKIMMPNKSTPGWMKIWMIVLLSTPSLYKKLSITLHLMSSRCYQSFMMRLTNMFSTLGLFSAKTIRYSKTNNLSMNH